MHKLMYTAIVGVMILVGCASFKSDSGKFLASTAQTVDSLMKGWGTHVATDHITPDQQQTVMQWYAMYQRAIFQASNAWNSAIITGNQTQWNAASNGLYNVVNNLSFSINQTQISPPLPKQ